MTNENRDSVTTDADTLDQRESGPYKPNWLFHALLLLLTLGTTTCTGMAQSDVGDLPMTTYHYIYTLATDPYVWGQGLAYALSVLAILFAHEMGHYIPARLYKVEVSPPYFLPGFPPFGTFGAFIRMQMDTISARSLFRIGAGGPYAGFVVALPLLIIGLMMSEVKPLPVALEGATLGDSLLMMGLSHLIFGELPAGHDVFLHPMAFAGWVGMFVTAFNLVPLGQLDGGHIAYTLFGKSFNKVAWGLLLVLIGLGITLFPGWLVLALFIIYMGPTHPPVVENDERISGMDRVWGYGALLMFAVTFIPRPLQVPTILDMILN